MEKLRMCERSAMSPLPPRHSAAKAAGVLTDTLACRNQSGETDDRGYLQRTNRFDRDGAQACAIAAGARSAAGGNPGSRDSEGGALERAGAAAAGRGLALAGQS